MASDRWVFDDAVVSKELGAFIDCLDKMVDDDPEAGITTELVLGGCSFNLAVLLRGLDLMLEVGNEYVLACDREQQLLDIIAGKYPNLQMLMVGGE